MEKYYKGIAASRRIAIGKAIVLLKSNIMIPRYTIEREENAIEMESQKLEAALAKTKNQLESLKAELIQKRSTLETGYLDSTILMLEDPTIHENVREKMSQRSLNVEYIFSEVIEEMADKLQQSDIDYFKERATDIRSIGQKVLQNLLGNSATVVPEASSESIIVAHTLSPPEVVHFSKHEVKAIVTEIGGKTSHVAIMAQDLKIPAVIGVEHITDNVNTGDSVIVDGTTGTVIANPEKDTEKLYSLKVRGQHDYDMKLLDIREKPCQTKEGKRIELLANMDLEEELELVGQCGCMGIGLFRTEYLFLNSRNMPDEDTQYAIYSNVIKGIQPFHATIRIIDIGGDKKPDYLDYYEEANPFLGLRGIRFALTHTDMLKTQIRAILRASCHGNTRLMFPMVNDIDELNTIFDIIDHCKQQLEQERIDYNPRIEIGVMIETPSSVILLDKFLPLVDFVSVGTNDLIQYTLAIDRGNGMVAEKYNPMHPAILRTLRHISDLCLEHNTEASICGEMAGDPLYTLLLLGLGYRALSMSTMNIPTIKDIIIHSSLADADALTRKAFDLTSAEEILLFVRREMIDRFKYLEDYFR
jgi:phosphotransferase system enzyme I (PtsI)